MACSSLGAQFFALHSPHNRGIPASVQINPVSNIYNGDTPGHETRKSHSLMANTSRVRLSAVMINNPTIKMVTLPGRRMRGKDCSDCPSVGSMGDLELTMFFNRDSA